MITVCKPSKLWCVDYWDSESHPSESRNHRGVGSLIRSHEFRNPEVTVHTRRGRTILLLLNLLARLPLSLLIFFYLFLLFVQRRSARAPSPRRASEPCATRVTGVYPRGPTWYRAIAKDPRHRHPANSL